MTSRITFLLILIVIGLAGVTGMLEFEDDLLEEASYCDRLQNKVHKDYKQIKSVCVQRHWSK